ncbi:MAG: hypothetical protein LBG48_05970 [Rickettsiales bacterium]|jgi:sulfatase maturation enzyme AslB (radical SAM superfamily)|nr:hypothetical protein [Rickettsiales bacterium]
MDNVKQAKAMGLKFSLFMVLDHVTIKYPENIFNFIKNINPENGVVLNPLFLTENNNITKDTINESDFYNFLVNFYELWKKDGEIIKNNVIRSTIMGIQGEIPHLCFLAGRCSQFISVDNGGNLYSKTK